MGWSGIYRSVSGQKNYDWQTTQYDSTVERAYHSSTLVSAFRVRSLLGRRAAVEANLSIERASGTLDGAAGFSGAPRAEALKASGRGPMGLHRETKVG